MARIGSYPIDAVIQDKDAWIGTENTNRVTRQFTAKGIAEYIDTKNVGLVFVGATALADGKKGLVPAPVAGQEGMYLKGDLGGGWTTIPVYTLDVPTGTTNVNLINTDGAGAIINSFITLTGGTYLTSVHTSGSQITFNHDNTTRSDTTSAVSPAAGASVPLVASVTSNATGHVTAIDVKTVTWPADSDTTYTIDVPNATTSINLAGSDGSNDPIAFTTVAGNNGMTISRTDANTLNFNSKWQINNVNQDGYVPKGQANANKFWATDANGNPGWTFQPSQDQTLTSTGTSNASTGVVLSQNGGTVIIKGDGTTINASSNNTTNTITLAAINRVNTTYTLPTTNGSNPDLVLTASSGATDIVNMNGTANEVTVEGSGTNTLTFGLPDDVTIAGELTVSGTGQSSFGGQVTIPQTPSADTDAASKKYVDDLVSGGLTFRGTFNAATGEILSGVSTGSKLYNCPGGAGTRIAVAVGDYYIVATAGGSFYCSGATLDIGDSIIATAAANADASVVTGWSVVQSDEGVVSFTNANGTFVSAGTVNSNATGAVTMGTIDLSATGTKNNTTFLRGDNTWAVPAYVSYSAMTTSTLGLGKIKYDFGSTPAAESQSTTASRTYGVTKNASDQLVVNVPWVNSSDVNSVTASGAATALSGLSSTPNTGSVVIGLDIHGRASLGTPASDDELMIYDTSTAKNVKVLVSDLASYAGSAATNQVTYWTSANEIGGAAGFTFAGGAAGAITMGGTLTVSGDVGIGAAATDGNFQVKKAGINTGITNVLMNASFSEAGGSLSGLSIGYRTDETTAVLAPRTATGNLAFMSYDGGWSESMRIVNNGKIGIGTNSPIVPVHIVGAAVNNPSNGNGGYEVMQIFDNTSYATGVGGGIGFGGNFTASNSTIFSEIRGIKENATDSNYAGALSFSTRLNGGSITERMRINSAGDVIVGSTNPVKLIDQSYGGELGLYYGTTNHWKQYHYSDNSLRFNYNGSGADELTIDTSGNATFAGAVEVNGNFIVDGAGVSTDFQLRRSANPAALLTINAPGGSPNGSVFSINGNSVMTLDQNQNATFAGIISGTGLELSNYAQLKVDDAEIYWTNTANNDYWRWKRDASDNFICDHYNGSSTTSALSFNSSQAATFGNTVQIDNASGNTLTLRKGTGTAAIGFGGTGDQAVGLIEGIAAGGFGFYVGSGTLASPTWANAFIINSDKDVYNYQSGNKANTYYGYKAGNYGGTGISNTAVGYEAGGDLTTGVQNVCFGRHSGDKLTTGINNVNIGTNAGFSNTDGQQNVYVGTAAGYTSPGQNYNTFVGHESGHYNTANENTAVGRMSLHQNTSGNRNVGIGYNALRLNTIGVANTALGALALENNTDGDSNTALGYQAADANTTGDANTAIGTNSLGANSTGSRNTTVGNNSGLKITGSDNVALGYEALATLTSSGQNIGIGVNAGLKFTGSRLVAIGYGAGKELLSDVDNVFIGQQAGENRTAGVDNTFVGAYANYNGASTGCCNTGFGKATGYSLTSGVQNTLLGRQAGFYITDGDNNTMLGHNAGLNSTGDGNTFVGSYAGDAASQSGGYNTGVGRAGLSAVTSGTYHTALGYNAGDEITTGTNCTAIGHAAGSGSSPRHMTTNSNEIVIGNNSIVGAYVRVAWTTGSDKRDKINFGDVPHGLDFVNKLKPTSYDLRKERDSDETIGERKYGFIAQEILELEGDNPVIIDNSDENKLALQDSNLIPILVNAIQELKAEIELLKNK